MIVSSPISNFNKFLLYVLARQELAADTSALPNICTSNRFHADIIRTGGIEALLVDENNSPSI
jgi:hypothetical protein